MFSVFLISKYEFLFFIIFNNIVRKRSLIKSHYKSSMNKERLITLIFLFISVFNTVYCQIGGRGTYEFLNLSAPARIVALGGTLISVKDRDLNLAINNPSLLDSNMHNNLSLSYVNYLADIQYGYATYSRTYKNLGSFSAGIQFVDYGQFSSADVAGEILGHFTSAEYALNLSYSRPINSFFSFGSTVKTIYSKLSEYTSFGNAVDVGVIYYNEKHLNSLGLVMKNVGVQWKSYSSKKEPLPFEIQLGFSKKIKHAPLRLNLTATHLEKWDLTYADPALIKTDPITGDVVEKSNFSIFADKFSRHLVFGGEILLSKNFHFRVGYNFQKRQELKLESHTGITGVSIGFGLKVSKFNLSYGYAKYHLAGGSNHFTISTNFSEFYSRKK
jgi:hypothetical protein